jgi:hypothetical protein
MGAPNNRVSIRSLSKGRRVSLAPPTTTGPVMRLPDTARKGATCWTTLPWAKGLGWPWDMRWNAQCLGTDDPDAVARVTRRRPAPAPNAQDGEPSRFEACKAREEAVLQPPRELDVFRGEEMEDLLE